MEEKEIIEGNKLIAEFYGLLLKDGNWYSNGIMVYNERLKYHSSWDWLMPVVEKIDGLYIREDLKINRLNIFSEKEDVYNAVIEFIEWHNLTKV